MINPGQLGSAFSGHNGGFTMEYSNWYIENCYVEGCGSVIGDTSLVNHVHVYNITLKNSGSLRGGTGLENRLHIARYLERSFKILAITDC